VSAGTVVSSVGTRPHLPSVRLSLLWVLGLLLLIPIQDTHYPSAQEAFNHAYLLFVHGDLEQSQREAEHGYLRFRVRKPEWASRFRLLEADAMLWRGLYPDALKALSDFRPAAGDDESAIHSAVIQSVALARQEQPQMAEEKLTFAESLCGRMPELDACGQVLRTRGIFDAQRGHPDQGRKVLLSMLAFARKRHDVFLEANALLNLGWIDLQLEHFDDALDWSRSAAQVAATIGAEDTVTKASGNQGSAYYGLGDSERAGQLFREAKTSAALRGNLRSELGWIQELGDVFRDTGDAAAASASYKEALSIAERIRSKWDITNLLEELTYSSIDEGKLADAGRYLDRLDPLIRDGGEEPDVVRVQFARARIAATQSQFRQAESLFRAVEHNPTSRMRWMAEYQLARLYETEGNSAQADRMYRTSLCTVEDLRKEVKGDSRLTFLARATRIYDDYIHFLAQHGKAGGALAVADQSRARTLEQGLGVSARPCGAFTSGVQPGSVARKMNATLLFYSLGRTQSYLWAITPTKTDLIPLPSGNEILTVIARYRKALQGLGDPIENSNRDGVALYNTLVAPAAHLIKPASPVVILSAGQLSQFNFETLIVPGPKPHYWIEDATLISAPSLRLLAFAKPPEQSGHKLLLMGDAISPGPDYPELPGASTELSLVSQRFPAQDELIYARERSTPAAYFNSPPQQFAYIHFVAHGVSSTTDPLDSAIILSSSGKSEDSFKLHARDIMQHPIHARLVTISACYGSGARTFGGEGAVGLAWAFMHAGAHNVIGALWEVSDTSTPHLMGELYRELQNGRQPGAALRQAKLTLLHSKSEFRKPFYWAPLQIYTGL